MRITNKMMTNNMMTNINKNKINMTNLEQQYSTGKKIQRPSDDPIITVRALKLRTNLAELNQYYEKNIPDAKSWMDVTESALTTVNDILSKMNTYCVQGSTDTLTAKDRSSIVQNLMEMREQVYQEGNTNYAGRYVFTGYKTDSSLVFDGEVKNLSYNIRDSFSGEDIKIGSMVTGAYELKEFEDPAQTFDEAPKLVDTYRIQLSYDQLEDKDISSISYTKLDSDGKELDPEFFSNISRISSTDKGAYDPDPNKIHFIPETGELIIGKDAYEVIRTASNIQVAYDKSSFHKGELKPEHYFNCTMTDENKPEQDPITYSNNPQEIQYEINFNQKLTINTEGRDSFSHKVDRFIDDILASVNDVVTTEEKIAEVEKRMEDTTLKEEEQQKYQKMLGQLETELDLKKEVMQSSFSKGITVTNKEQDRVNVALADLGSRYVRLELTENRLASQQVDFEELMSTNEDADLVDTIIKFYAAQAVYNASLSATSKAVKNSLLDFI